MILKVESRETFERRETRDERRVHNVIGFLGAASERPTTQRRGRWHGIMGEMGMMGETGLMGEMGGMGFMS
mgnify:FL=1